METLKSKKISMWIDRYEDIFSDFDPRPYSERVLSDDFLNESRKMFKEKKPGKFELRILVPKTVRNLQDEEVITRRLKSYFKTRRRQEELVKNRTIRFGIYFTITGFFLMIIATLLMHARKETLLLSFLVILLEPAGWFAVWYGMDQIFYSAAANRRSFVFFKKLSNADIVFEEY